MSISDAGRANTIRTGLLIAIAALGMPLLAGCTEDTSAGPPAVLTVAEAIDVARDKGFEWESAVLEDGTISGGEYEQAYDRYMACQEDLDYVFDKPKVLDPVSGLQWQAIGEWKGTGEPGLLDPNNKCDTRFYLIETPYLQSTPHRMDPVLREAFMSCLDTNGIAYNGDEVSFADFTESLSDAELGEATSGSHVSCLLDSVKTHFPDVLWVSYGR